MNLANIQYLDKAGLYHVVRLGLLPITYKEG